TFAEVTSGTRRDSPCSAGGELLELAIAENLVLARFEHRVELLFLQLAQTLGQHLFERDHHRRGIAMRAPRRLVDDLVDEAQLLEPHRGNPESFGGLR